MTDPPAQSGNGPAASAAATSTVATDSPTPTQLRPWLPEAENRASGAAPAKRKTSEGEKLPGSPVSRRRQGRGIWLGIIALAISFAATLLLARDEPVRTWAALGIVAAGLLGIVAWGSTPWLPAIVKPRNVWPLGPFSLERMVRLLGIVVAGELVWWGNAQFAANQYERFGLASVLWVASMVVLVVSVAGWPVPGQAGLFGRFSRPPASAVVASGDEISLSTTTPIGGVSSSLPVRPRRSDSRAARIQEGMDPQPGWTRWEVLVFVGIVVLAVVVRVWDLTSIPYSINPDEILTGRVANQNFLVPNNISIFQTVWPGIDLPAFWFLIVAQFMKLGDSTLAALRLPSALFGAAAVIPFYFMLRSVWGRVGAITGTSVLAFGVASVHFSRLAVNNGVTVFFWATCFFFLLRALRRGRPVDWVLAGIAGGLSEHFYYGTRLLPFVLLAFGGYLLVVHWSRVRYYILCFPLLALAYMAALGPLFTWFSMHPDLYLGQKPGARPLTWNHLPVSLDDLTNMWNTLWPLFTQNLLTVSTLPATDAFYFAPMLLPFEAALLALGVGLLIWRWRQPAAFLFLVSGFGVLLAGGTLVPYAGNVNHWTPAFPSMYAALALPVVSLAWAVGRYGGRVFRNVGAVALGCLIVVLGVSNGAYYLTQYHAYRAEMDMLAAKARFQVQFGTGYIYRSVGKTWQPYDTEATPYLIKNVDGGQIWNPAAELPLPGVTGKGLAFTFFPDQVQYLDVVQALYPVGTHGQVKSQGGELLFDYYLVPPSIAGQNYGTTVQVYAPGDSKPRQTTRVATFGAVPAGATYPLQARWWALLYITYPEVVAFAVSGVPASIVVDGQTRQSVPGDTLLQAGWHQVSVEATLSGPADIRLLLSEAGADLKEVAQTRLWAVQPGYGLLGSVAPAGATRSPTVRNEQFIGFTQLGAGDRMGPESNGNWPLRASWTGEINAFLQGIYQFEIRGNASAQLFVDGQKIVSACAGVEVGSATGQVELAPGWHTFRLDALAVADTNTLELYWTTPPGRHTVIPPGAFRFAPETASGPTSAPTIPATLDCQAP